MDLTRQYVAALRQMMGRPSSSEEAASLGRRPRSERKDQERPSPSADKEQEVEGENQQQHPEVEDLVSVADAGTRTSVSSGGSTRSILLDTLIL